MSRQSHVIYGTSRKWFECVCFFFVFFFFLNPTKLQQWVTWLRYRHVADKAAAVSPNTCSFGNSDLANCTESSSPAAAGKRSAFKEKQWVKVVEHAVLSLCVMSWPTGNSENTHPPVFGAVWMPQEQVCSLRRYSSACDQPEASSCRLVREGQKSKGECWQKIIRAMDGENMNTVRSNWWRVMDRENMKFCLLEELWSCDETDELWPRPLS